MSTQKLVNVYEFLSYYLTEKEYTDTRRRRTMQTLKKYRLRFVDTLTPHKVITIDHATKRAGFLKSLSDLYKKYNGSIPEYEKIAISNNYGFKYIPSAGEAQQEAREQYRRWRNRSEYTRQWARNTADDINKRDRREKYSRRAWLLFSLFYLAFVGFSVHSEEKKRAEMEAEKRRSKRKRKR